MLSEPAYYKSKESLSRVMAGDNKDGGVLTRAKKGDESLFKISHEESPQSSKFQVLRFLDAVLGDSQEEHNTPQKQDYIIRSLANNRLWLNINHNEPWDTYYFAFNE